jgi:hypothetical protein
MKLGQPFAASQRIARPAAALVQALMHWGARPPRLLPCSALSHGQNTTLGLDQTVTLFFCCAWFAGLTALASKMATANCSQLASASRTRFTPAPVHHAHGLMGMRAAPVAAPAASAAPCMRGRLPTAQRLRARAGRSPSRSGTDAAVRGSSSSSHLDRSCQLLAEQQLRMWLGVGDSADLQFNRVSAWGCRTCIGLIQQL